MVLFFIKRMKKNIKEIIPYILIIILVILIKSYVVSPIRVIGSSMESTLFDGDIMILNKISYRFNKIKRFDIVVIDHEDKSLIKRVIGLPGDKIEYKDNKLYINDKNYSESYLNKGTITYDFELDELLGMERVPEDCYFVLGDNREISSDSRIIGFIDKKYIEGKTSIIIFPFSRIGIKK